MSMNEDLEYEAAGMNGGNFSGGLGSLSGVDLRGASVGFVADAVTYGRADPPPASKPAAPRLHRALSPRRQPIGLRCLGDV